eukprot:CAMPEP_0171457126 /NCGR_PEP_ID=MMETSP0945-20130129/3330_1 /TAXON_ID=109269 /ORGANISM="Vaucheria litorea, Strain CCMP2940" /LENGTH=600 /DNA_ID=CAMNT_0011982673 /DNA_START=99 /DNA_END=1899 /DNA_ORIENTATION=+
MFLAHGVTETECVLGSDGFDVDVQIDTKLLLQFSYLENSDSSVLRIKLTLNGKGWIGFGSSADGEMIGGTAVIGLPEDLTMLTYDMKGNKTENVVPSSVQNITPLEFIVIDETVVIEYLQPLISENIILDPSMTQYFLYAYTDEVPFLDKHDEHGTILLNIDECISNSNLAMPTLFPSISPTSVPTISPTTSPAILPTLSPTSSFFSMADFSRKLDEVTNDQLFTAATASCVSDLPEFENQQEFDSKLKFYWNVLVEGLDYFIEAKMVFAGEGWVAWGISSNGKMEGSLSVLALPSTGVALYDIEGYSKSDVKIRDDSLQTLVNATVTQENGVTTVDFVKAFVGDVAGDISLSNTETNDFIWAYRNDNFFSEHSEKGSVKMNLGNCTSGVVATSLINGNKLTDAQIHGLVMSIVWLGIVPFAVLVAHFGKCFKYWYYVHASLQTVAVILTAIGFYLAVELPFVEGDHFSCTHGKFGLAVVVIIFFQFLSALKRPKKSKPPHDDLPARKRWVFMHRLIAAVLIVLAYYTIHEGIELPESDLSDKWGTALVVVAIVYIALSLLLEVATDYIAIARGRVLMKMIKVMFKDPFPFEYYWLGSSQ